MYEELIGKIEKLANKIRDKKKISIENIYFIKIGRVDHKTGRFTSEGKYSFAKCEISKDGYPEFTDVLYPGQYYLYDHVWNKRGIRCCKKVISLKEWLQDSNSNSTKKILMDGWIYYGDLKYICDQLNKMEQPKQLTKGVLN